MAINSYYINNNSFHGLQISNLNTQELLMHFIIVFSQLFNRSVKPNSRFLIKTSKLSILLIAYMALALLRGGNFSIRRYTLLKATLIVYRPGYFTVHPPPAPSGPKFSNSENCCGSENAMPPKIFWDMEGHRGHFRSKNVFFFKKHILEKIHNKSHYFFKF